MHEQQTNSGKPALPRFFIEWCGDKSVSRWCGCALSFRAIDSDREIGRDPSRLLVVATVINDIRDHFHWP